MHCGPNDEMPLPEELRALVGERSEGNPLFTEEIVRMFIDHGVLRATQAERWELAQAVDDVEVPRSIHALIATRLDGLPQDEKALLQDAAVVGRAFWAGAVARLAGSDLGDVRAALGRLRVKEQLAHGRQLFGDIRPTECLARGGTLQRFLVGEGRNQDGFGLAVAQRKCGER